MSPPIIDSPHAASRPPTDSPAVMPARIPGLPVSIAASAEA